MIGKHQRAGDVHGQLVLFKFQATFNEDISSWNVAAATNMAGMFHGAGAFNQNLSCWATSAVTSMAWMFSEASAFNGDATNPEALLSAKEAADKALYRAKENGRNRTEINSNTQAILLETQ